MRITRAAECELAQLECELADAEARGDVGEVREIERCIREIESELDSHDRWLEEGKEHGWF